MKKRYYEILVRGNPLQPIGGPPYRFKTRKEALTIVSICYGIASLEGPDIKIVSSTKL
jgi:hypothetical protein